jgi:glycosyltransferase involved in cell wall biosynthesis
MSEEVLVITTLDYTVEKNQRCQRVAKALAQKYGSAVVLSKHRNISVRTFEIFKKMFPSVRVYREGQVKVYDLNPPLNQSFARPIPLLGLVTDVLTVLSMILLFFTNVGRRYRLCYAEGPWEMLVALALKLFGRVQFIIYGDIDFIPAFQIRPFRVLLTAALENYTLKRADLVTCTGRLLAQKREKELGIKPFVNHNGVNYHAFSAGAVKEEHAPSIIYFGNLVERYSGLSIALDAFSRIREKVEGLTMTIIGPDPDGTIDRRIEALGIGDGVRRLDPVLYIDLPIYIRRADVGYALFPPNMLRTYAFPMKVIEYMAGGLAVIGTEGTETELILKKYESGISIPFDEETYVNTVVDLFAERDRIDRMVKKGVNAASDFDWDLLMKALLDHIEEACGTS